MPESFIKILAAIAPAVVLAFIMLRRDKRPEPIGWLLAAVCLGILIGPIILTIGDIILPDIPADSFLGAFMTSFVNAAVPEEGLKFAALYLLAKRCRHFDEMFDGIVYAVCIGMGFAGFENILYLFGAEDEWMFVGVSRALLAVPAHYFFAVIMGSFFSLGWFDKRNRRFYLTAAFALPVIVHGLYDTLCFSMSLNEDLSGLILILFLLGFKYIRNYVKSLTNTMLNLDGYDSTK